VLVFFGIGFGVFTVGGVSLLMAVTTAEMAASYLALWSVIQLVSRGLGIAAGGVLRDIFNTLSGEIAVFEMIDALASARDAERQSLSLKLDARTAALAIAERLPETDR
jgi:hypothetical protein